MPEKDLKKKYEQTKKLYLKKIKDELETLTDTLADLKQKSQKTMGAGKTEALAEIRKLEQKIEDLKKNARGLATASEDAWDLTKQEVDKTWKSLRNSAKKVLAKFS
jgi:Na+/phosphate symporter